MCRKKEIETFKKYMYSGGDILGTGESPWAYLGGISYENIKISPKSVENPKI